MSKNKGVISEIISRKILQIIGMYIASVWLAVEISDWMSDRFDLSEQFATYVFVGMLSMLPTVILVAWGHGKPGKDDWSIIEKSWIPINLALAVFAIIVLVKPVDVSPQQSLVNSTQKTPSLQKSKNQLDKEVNNESSHQSVISFFWDNKTQDESLDWISYGASWLLSQDLKRTPLISVQTPYDSKKVFNELLKKGFDRAIGAPVSLAKKIAQSKSAKWLVQGSFTTVEDKLELTAQLFNVETGKQVKSMTTTNENWLVALDKISNEIGEVILTSANVATNIIPQLSIIEHTSDNLQAIELLIAAQNLVALDNNFKKAVSTLSSVIVLDPTFAEAHVLAMGYYRGLGDFPNAIVQAQSALELDHKLYKETFFLMKASIFGLQGKQENAIKVLEKWVNLYPDNTEALKILGQNYLLLGYHQEQAKEVFIKIYEKDGSGQGNHALLDLGKIYRLQDDKANALKYLNKYKEANQTEGLAYFELADAYKQFGLLDKAKEMYEEASLYGNKDNKAEIGLANIEAASGDYKTAILQLNLLLEKSKTPGQKVEILSNLQDIYLYKGQIGKALEMNERMLEPSSKIMAPIAVLFNVKGSRVYLLILLERYEEANELMKEVKKELKPPFDQLIGAFSKYIYEYQHDVENYKKSLGAIEGFIENMNMTTMKPDVLRSKGVLSYWEKDYEKSLAYLNEGIDATKQSFVTLITSSQVDDMIYLKSQTLIALGQYDEAFQNLNIILDRTPLFAKAHYLKAQAYNSMGDIENRSISLRKAHMIWQEADEDFMDYKILLEFEKELEASK